MRFLFDEDKTEAVAVNTSAISREQAERRYNAGYASYYDAIIAQNIELSSKLDQVQIRFRRMNVDVQLAKALGGGRRSSGLAQTGPAGINTALTLP